VGLSVDSVGQPPCLSKPRFASFFSETGTIAAP
jgi:hypothetical protein